MNPVHGAAAQEFSSQHDWNSLGTCQRKDGSECIGSSRDPAGPTPLHVRRFPLSASGGADIDVPGRVWSVPRREIRHDPESRQKELDDVFNELWFCSVDGVHLIRRTVGGAAAEAEGALWIWGG